MLTHGYGGWWFDMWGGWFEHLELLRELRALQEIWPRHEHPADARRVPPHTLCVVVDERLAEEDASFGALCNPIFCNRFALAHCGRPYVIYLRNDLPLLDLQDAPMLWLLGCRNLSKPEQSLLAAYTRSGGSMLHTDTDAVRLITAGKSAVALDLPLTLSAAELRLILNGAGLRCWLESEDVFYAGRGFMAVHAAAAGNKRIHLPGTFKCEAIRPAEKEQYTGSLISFVMQAHETRIWRITPMPSART